MTSDLKFVQTRGGNKYFITFVDDNTKYEVENQLNKKIKVLRSD